jgi:hypothetical protein
VLELSLSLGLVPAKEAVRGENNPSEIGPSHCYSVPNVVCYEVLYAHLWLIGD